MTPHVSLFKQKKWKCCWPVAAAMCTGAALLFPAVATTLRLYRVPGTRELKPDWGAAVPETRVLRLDPEVVSFRLTSYQSTWPQERDQDTDRLGEPPPTSWEWSSWTSSWPGPTGSDRGHEGFRGHLGCWHHVTNLNWSEPSKLVYWILWSVCSYETIIYIYI